MHHACAAGAKEVALALVRAGASLEAKTNGGKACTQMHPDAGGYGLHAAKEEHEDEKAFLTQGGEEEEQAAA